MSKVFETLDRYSHRKFDNDGTSNWNDHQQPSHQNYGQQRHSANYGHNRQYSQPNQQNGYMAQQNHNRRPHQQVHSRDRDYRAHNNNVRPGQLTFNNRGDRSKPNHFSSISNSDFSSQKQNHENQFLERRLKTRNHSHPNYPHDQGNQGHQNGYQNSHQNGPQKENNSIFDDTSENQSHYSSYITPLPVSKRYNRNQTNFQGQNNQKFMHENQNLPNQNKIQNHVSGKSSQPTGPRNLLESKRRTNQLRPQYL